MPYRNQYDAAFGNSDIEQRVSLALIVKAQAICEEASPAVERRALAVEVLNDPDAYVRRFLYVCAVAPSTNDAGVDAAIAAAWDQMAGI